MPNRLTLDADAEHAGERQLTRLRRRFLAARKRISPRICRHTIYLWNHSLSRSKCLKRLRFLSFQRRCFRPQVVASGCPLATKLGAASARGPALVCRLRGADVTEPQHVRLPRAESDVRRRHPARTWNFAGQSSGRADDVPQACVQLFGSACETRRLLSDLSASRRHPDDDRRTAGHVSADGALVSYLQSGDVVSSVGERRRDPCRVEVFNPGP